MSQPRIFAVIGANGFIGSKLVRRLSASAARVRALVRRPDAMEPSAKWEVVKFDLDDAAPSLQRALEGVDIAYYLVHSMAAGARFAELDRNYALKFAYAAQAAGVGHIVYLGGLYPRGANDLSAHLQSRREVGEILLRECGALVIRASIVLGRGSASYEILRSLVLKLPVMVTPQWVLKKCQPIDADDAIEVLARAAEVPGGRVVDLAGRDVVTYRDMMLMMAEELGLKRVIIPVPVLSPGLSSHWLRFICDSPLPVARTLIESLRHDTVMEGTDLCTEVGLQPIGIRETLARAPSANQAARLLSHIDLEWHLERNRLRHLADLIAALLEIDFAREFVIARLQTGANQDLPFRAQIALIDWKSLTERGERDHLRFWKVERLLRYQIVVERDRGRCVTVRKRLAIDVPSGRDVEIRDHADLLASGAVID